MSLKVAYEISKQHHLAWCYRILLTKNYPQNFAEILPGPIETEMTSFAYASRIPV
jgi:hypothetical protein